MADIEGAERVQPTNWQPGMYPSVLVIRRQEPCWALRERVLNGQRYQIVTVIRNDEQAECWLPLPVETVSLPEFDILAAGVHTVAEVLDWADSQRVDRHWENVLTERAETHDLIKEFLEQAENDAEIVRNRTVFGAGKTGATISRNGWHHKPREPRQFKGIDPAVRKSVEKSLLADDSV